MISLHSGLIRADDDATAFLDRDWLGSTTDGPLMSLAARDAEEAAGRLLAVADRVTQLLEAAPAGGVEVLGDGLVARAVRAGLGAREAPDERPAAVVDCAGNPARLLDAIARVREMGVVVLAGEPVGRELAIDLYVDVHRRGLRLVGAPRPDVLAPVTDAPRVRAALDRLARVPSGAAPPADAAWFTVDPAR
jgi:threonine dehydrogenase-like Zn-dependent dehydrogenase